MTTHTNFSQVFQTLISRSVKLEANATVQGLQSNIESPWRVVLSVGGSSDVQVKITVRSLSSSYTVNSCVSRGSATSFTGFGSCTVELQNKGGVSNEVELSFDQQTTEDPSYTFCAPRQSISNAAYVAVVSDRIAGYAPAFCKYLRLFASGDINLRFVDSAGNIVGQLNGVTPTNLALSDIRVPAFAEVRASSVAANEDIMAVWSTD